MNNKIALIYLENFRHNIRLIQSHASPNTKLCLAVKADAYGHGAVRIAEEAVKLGVSYFAVSTVEEGVALRENGISLPILVLSLIDATEYENLIVHELSLVVDNSEQIGALALCASRLNKTVGVHLKVNTGMGRVGCKVSDVSSLAKEIVQTNGLSLQGVCTHLSVSDSLSDDDSAFTKKQITRFTTAIEAIEGQGINPGIRHCANSGAVFLHPDAHFDMVRLGIAAYGYYPSRELRDYYAQAGKPLLKPIMELQSKLVKIFPLSAGEPVSYGRIWTAKEDTFIGIVPMGYEDGIRRSLSPGLKVSIKNKKHTGLYPVVGRICMDQLMVNLGAHHSCKVGDTVVFFGPSDDSAGNGQSDGNEGNARMTADDLAELCDTISYELLCGIGKRVEKVFVE